MTRVNALIEDREGGRYFVRVESSFPNQRAGEDFTIGYEAAFDRAKEFCREFGVDDATALPMMRPALQADIDRAQEAQEAAGDVDMLVPGAGDVIFADAGDVESAKEWREGSLRAINTAMAPVTFEPKEPEFVDSSEIVRRKPGRPRKEA